MPTSRSTAPDTKDQRKPARVAVYPFERLRGVMRVVYLIFNEGYAATGGDRLVREELCDEAIRLGELLSRLMPDDAEVWGLSALMLLQTPDGPPG